MHRSISRDTALAVPIRSLTRRRVIAALGVAGLSGAVPGSGLARQVATPAAAPAATPVAEAPMDRETTMPDWRFGLVGVADPFEGDITRPDAVPQGIRVLAVEVTLANLSDQPMDFSVADIRLRDADSIEYRGGEYIGSGPRLASQNLPSDERARGWVWFGVPAAASLASVVFMAPSPVLRVRLD